ncbi:MAG: hypothetical protein HOV81_22040 [Kofleriaceae bacterium]|nr:hypothetical protein [Kofleriaceae bacterium]
MRRSGPLPAAGYRESPASPLTRGQVIASSYAIKGEIARTDTGVVFEAHDMPLDRLVALKLAWRDPGTPSLVIEAKRCAAVRDPCAVQVHAMGVHDGVELAIAERVVGTLLSEELSRALTPELYMARLKTLVAAVARAHDAGIAVGDISGSTVLVLPEGRLVLGRLSLSQVPAFGPHGQILAPEVVRGDVDAADPVAAEAIDLYGLGCVAIEMACGAPPFSDEDPARELRGHASEPPPRIADLREDLPGELSDLVDWLLAKQPVARPRSARDVLAQIEAVVERSGQATRTLRVLIVDGDTARARWLWGLARRAHAATLVEIASEGTDAAHKLNRDQPDLVFVDASLRGAMNALELCMYARGLASWHHTVGRMYVIGHVSDADAMLFDHVDVQVLRDDATLPGAMLDLIRSAVASRPPIRKSRTRVTG